MFKMSKCLPQSVYFVNNVMLLLLWLLLFDSLVQFFFSLPNIARSAAHLRPVPSDPNWPKCNVNGGRLICILLRGVQNTNGPEDQDSMQGS